MFFFNIKIIFGYYAPQKKSISLEFLLDFFWKKKRLLAPRNAFLFHQDSKPYAVSFHGETSSSWVSEVRLVQLRMFNGTSNVDVFDILLKYPSLDISMMFFEVVFQKTGGCKHCKRWPFQAQLDPWASRQPPSVSSRWRRRLKIALQDVEKCLGGQKAT